MITLIKVGGSLITDKQTPRAYRSNVMQQLAAQFAQAYRAGHQRWIIGHGSGSFGHMEARKYNTMGGAASAEQWYGFCCVAEAAAALNQLVWSALVGAGLPVVRHSPFSTAVALDGALLRMDTALIEQSMAHGLIPLVHGDVAFDQQRGATIISTEAIFTYLTHILPVGRILLLGEVDGVLDERGQVIPAITPATFERHRHAIGGSAGTDVTGGMLTKVTDMLALVDAMPHLRIQILNGLVAGNLARALTTEDTIGTLIHR